MIKSVGKWFILVCAICMLFFVARQEAAPVQLKGAGILPYSKDQQGNIIFWISREAYGVTKGTYADFGGGVEKTDQDTNATAAREFVEESMGLFQSPTGQSLNFDNTKAVLDNTPLLHLINPGFKYQFCIMPVANDPNIFSEFNKQRAVLLGELLKHPSKSLFACTEKDVLVTIYQKDLLTSLQKNSRLVKVTDSSNARVEPGSYVRLRDGLFSTLKLAFQKKLIPLNS